MSAKILIFVIFFFAYNICAQQISPKKTDPKSNSQTSQSADELLKHLSAAETYQVSGDLTNAAIENRIVLGIALQRIGNTAIEEGQYAEAVKILNDSLVYLDTAPNRTNLAIAYLRQNQFDKAIVEAQKAISIDPKYSGARYILGNIYFTIEDYQAALPELEKVLLLAPDFDAAHALGLTYLHLKQTQRAKLLFEELMTAFGKESPDLHIMFGQAYEKTNYPLEAEREFKRALEIKPQQLRASFFLGYVILQHGGSDRINEATKAFEAELKLTPEDFYSNFFAGVGAATENKHEVAIKYLQKAAQIQPDKSEAYLFLGQSQIELDDLVSAERNLRKAIELEKTDQKAKFQARRTHFLLGRLLLRTNRKDEGEKELAIARQLQQESLDSARSEINQILGQVVANPQVKPDGTNSVITAEKMNLAPERIGEITKIKSYLSNILAQSFHNLAVIDTQKGQIPESLEHFASASKWKPDFPGLDRNWGIVSFRAGQYKTAIEPLARHLKVNPNDNLIRQMLGASYHFTGDFAKSVETLKPFEAVLTGNAELTYFYVISLVQLKRNAEAIPILNKLSEISQTKPESLFYAAQALMILGDYERAAKEFKTVLALSPNITKANYYVGQSLIRLNRFDQAESFFAKELELNPADYLAKYHLALTLIERKIHPEKTVTLLEETISLKFDYADARYQLGKILLEKGEVQKAIEQLEAAGNSDPNKDFIQYQLSIAYRRASRKEDADRALKRYQDLKATNRKTDAPMGNNEK